ncbi:hypothetical protein BDV36DRAFT_268996 [Aspergillus pseudocaelatus]|uniref:Secreted protein n=1 Tax=Aspergillus pseudocaelatus TaxID=1825620 RepID=A0ABQ6W824_9EURO|nr:hypothetical protein BDV36DRAFT_268996 [Aspergillus pseudocaelatus]
MMVSLLGTCFTSTLFISTVSDTLESIDSRLVVFDFPLDANLQRWDNLLAWHWSQGHSRLHFCFRRRHSVHDVIERIVFPCFVALAMFDPLQPIKDIPVERHGRQ